METLLGENIEAYTPIIKTMRQWSDRKKMVEMPLLHGYVFAHITGAEHEKVTNTPGVVRFVRSEGQIALVKNHEIERLKQLVDLGYHMEASAIDRSYKKGDKVKISSGALKGIEGLILEDRGKTLFLVLLESIGQCISIRLPKEIIHCT